MNFRQIEAFRTVIACGTTTRAAEILRISQPAISRLLADLERTTKLKLFDRGKGRIRPTAEGLAFYDEVQRSEEHTSELQSLMRISYAVFCLKKKNEQNSKTRKSRPTTHDNS